MRPQRSQRLSRRTQRFSLPALFCGLCALYAFCVVSTSTYAQEIRPTNITVAQDGSGDYTTIQEAINACRDLGYARVTIHIKNGTYKEKLVIPSWKTAISLLGESRDHTIITYDDYSGKDNPNAGEAGAKPKLSTFTSYTMLVQGNDIKLENLTIRNTAGRVGQAVALHVEGDRVTIKNCNIIGNQDTLLVTRDGSRQYFKDCHIEGTTDFIFGEATALFLNCTIKSLSKSFITAASTREHTPFGFVFQNCKLIAGSEATAVYLGRPWRPFARTVFMHCELGSHIRVEGWDPWKGDAMFPDKDKTAFYAEYENFGPGADVTQRANWSKQLTKKEAKQYTLKTIFRDWNPESTK